MALKYNRTLVAVTNRFDGFENSDLNLEDLDIKLDPQPEAAEKVRRLIGLDQRGNDHSVMLALMCLESYPDLSNRFRDFNRTYQIGSGLRWLNSGPFSLSAGDLLPSERTGPPSVRRAPDTTEWPAKREILVRRAGGHSLDVSVGARLERVNSPVLQDLTTMAPDWPLWSGVSGLLQMPGVWEEGDTLTIRHLPGSPTIAGIRYIVQHPDTYAFMRVSPLADIFFDRSTIFVHEAMAALVCALGLSNTNLDKA